MFGNLFCFLRVELTFNRTNTKEKRDHKKDKDEMNEWLYYISLTRHFGKAMGIICIEIPSKW